MGKRFPDDIGTASIKISILYVKNEGIIFF